MTQPNREMTDLRARLRVDSTRAQAFLDVQDAYRLAGTVGGAAVRLRVSRETLTRCIKAYPELDRAIQMLRDMRDVIRSPA